jgi:pimeloyl-ACP methyl ester carboxylesterase
MAKYKIYLFVILLIIIVIGIVTVVARYRREISAARAQVDSLGSQVIETDCGPIEYARIGEGYPVLVINAVDDPIAVHENVRGLAEKIPNARLFVVPDGGHPLFGHTQEVKSEITQFLTIRSLVFSHTNVVRILPQL